MLQFTIRDVYDRFNGTEGVVLDIYDPATGRHSTGYQYPGHVFANPRKVAESDVLACVGCTTLRSAGERIMGRMEYGRRARGDGVNTASGWMTVSEVHPGNPAALHNPHAVKMRDEHGATHTFWKSASRPGDQWRHVWINYWSGTSNPHAGMSGKTCPICGAFFSANLVERIRSGTPPVADYGLVAFLDEELANVL